MSELIYSPGLEGVVAGETSISTIADGLRYRGYSIEDLADHATFEETAYLLLYGELPTASERDSFARRLADFAPVDPTLLDIIAKLPLSTPMMDVMRTGCSLLAHWDPETADNSHDANLRKAERLLAQLPVIMAARERLRQGESPIHPDATRSLASNLLWMLRGTEPSERSIKAMDVSLILYAEHEFNASTFTARVICSTLSDLHSSITGAIGALKGALHGGANERVMEVLDEVGSPDKAEAWVRDALARKVRIMGFGHRVYKTGDPRARYLKSLCQQLASETGNKPMEQMAEVIETIVTGEKGLPPNLDWPSARLYHYMELPVDLYTPLFVLSRVVGWSAHVIEQLDNNRLIRPRSRYVGAEARSWKPVAQRG
ncbi:citrate/2-methylcitrate synthase [Lignipirellula cremea]|uniref:Citrate synthase n=1 Tax=Lignipirellula cremea TaxID=2528010 RepID=A0A518DSU5_9BACT|nr:citrate/2-methylcitrate synthase [Lignipirellula cremea]QDU94912.1 Citrate synthase 2 [Lignipirellula cremea]